FGKAHEIGDDIGEFAGKHFPGAAEPGEHFVGNQEHVVTRAQRSDLLQKLHGVNDHSTHALQERLNNDGGDLVAALGQQILQLLHTLDVAGLALQSHGAAVAV